MTQQVSPTIPADVDSQSSIEEIPVVDVGVPMLASETLAVRDQMNLRDHLLSRPRAQPSLNGLVLPAVPSFSRFLRSSSRTPLFVLDNPCRGLCGATALSLKWVVNKMDKRTLNCCLKCDACRGSLFFNIEIEDSTR